MNDVIGVLFKTEGCIKDGKSSLVWTFITEKKQSKAKKNQISFWETG